MAYKMSDVGGFGTGALGDISNPSGQINSYANVTAISTNTVTIGTPSNGIYETFAVGKEILLHASAVLSGTDATKLGKYLVATITGVSGSVLTLSKDVAANLVANADLSTLVVQAITVAQFNTLTLSSGSIAPPVYSTTNKYGGIITYKCKTEQIFSGGSISLVDKGIPTASSAMRPLTAQETEMVGTAKHTTGWENHITSRQALMNCGDGVAMIWTKKTTISSASSRIGGTTAGVAYYPYALNDNSPAEVLGGSTILLASETIDGFAVSLISKGKGSGTGYGRCYIATETRLPNDEGLYSQDCLSKASRLRELGITSFGDGRTGDIALQFGMFNSIAPITAMSPRNVFTLGAQRAGMYTSFDVGTKVCVHATASKAGATADFGRFMIGTIVGVNGSIITLDSSLPISYSFADYYWQMIAIPQFRNLNVSGAVAPTNTWDGSSGGITVVMVNETMTMANNAWIYEYHNTKGLPYGGTNRPFLQFQCSGQQKDYLPISQGRGAQLYICKNIVFGSGSRLGHYTDGAKFGAGNTNTNDMGLCGSVFTGSYGNSLKSGGYAGGGGYQSAGGPFSSGLYGYGGKMGMYGLGDNQPGGMAGASLFLVADTITNFSVSLLGTGGAGDKDGNGNCGGAGYGGASGYNQFATWDGGGPGTCFVYANTIINPDYTGVVI